MGPVLKIEFENFSIEKTTHSLSFCIRLKNESPVFDEFLQQNVVIVVRKQLKY